jgi:hypothetical protein
MAHKRIQFPVLCLTTDVSELEKFVFTSSSPDLQVKVDETERVELHVCFCKWNQDKK